MLVANRRRKRTPLPQTSRSSLQRNHLRDVAERAWVLDVVAVLLAGGPGSGKSSVSQSLRDRALSSVDLDFGYARWEDVDGRVVGLPEAPTGPWLDRHFWRWGEQLDVALRSAWARPCLLALPPTCWTILTASTLFSC